MKQEKEAKISYWAAHFTTIVSVTLVLVIIGLISLMSIGAAKETQRLREQLEVNVVMGDSVADATADSLAKVIRTQPYCKEVKVITKADALKNWKRDTGEDLMEIFGVNPLSPEVSFTLKADYASPASLENVRSALVSVPGVEAVVLPEARLVDTMNDNITRLFWILGGIAVVMILISFVLINNTVHLTIYSRRFTIHTMQLVGATDGFIRRPFVLNNMLSGLIAGVVASGLLACVLAFAPGAGFSDIYDVISWLDMAGVAAGLMLIGALLCSMAALIATSRYLHKDYDQLFR
ncbi:MAG: hypothetical protein HDS82_02025 [Bacteroidales bacterium]|nr:hypothetical protein [Bacteroidales bacterium]